MAVISKAKTKEVIEYLRNAGASEEDIPTLVMTAFYESNFDTLAQNKDTEAIGLFQINASSFYDGETPDNTLRSFLGNELLSVTEFEKRLEDPQYNTNFAIHYLNVINKDLEDGSSQFGDVRDNNNDPFAVFEGYLDYVKPFIAGGKLKGRGEGKVEDITEGIGVYVDAFLEVNQFEVGDIPPVKTPETGRAFSEEAEELSILINRDGQETFVPTEIVGDLLETGKYTKKESYKSSTNMVTPSPNPIVEPRQPPSPSYDGADKTVIDFIAHIARAKKTMLGK